jgi:hypothetical protein
MLEKIKKIKKSTWILLGITLIGIFLRTYRFHDWMRFEGDQARDAMLVHEVVVGEAKWPVFGPRVDGTGVDASELNSFRLGPMYYYFQIISAKIFGDYPDKLAYPDVLFSILSIPLMYFFLKRYFTENISLAITGIYSISFFSIQYSRFAWNPNSIPFFVLLFLLSLNKFLIHKEKVYWFWAVMLGIALGIGIQLHGLVLFIFPAITFFVFVFSMKENWKVWKKWAVVFAIFVALNSGQLISEMRTGFANSKILINYVTNKPAKINQKSSFLLTLEKGIDCQIEFNSYLMVPFGQDSCSLNFVQLITKDKSDSFVKNLKNPIFEIGVITSFIFSLFGYLFLFHRCWKEEENKIKYFSRLLALYLGVSFIILLAGGSFNLRYFNVVFFVPFMFLGFFIDYLHKNWNRFNKTIIIIVFLSIAVINIRSIALSAKELSEKEKTGYNSSFLVQIEPIARYLVANSNGQKSISLDGKNAIMQIYYPLVYFMQKQGITLIRKSESGAISSADIPEFYISTRASDNSDSEKIGQIYISKSKN